MTLLLRSEEKPDWKRTEVIDFKTVICLGIISVTSLILKHCSIQLMDYKHKTHNMFLGIRNCLLQMIKIQKIFLKSQCP